MGYGIHPFAVKLIRVGRAFGSRDAALAAEIAERFGWRFDLGEQDEGEPTLETALHEIIDGRPLRDGYGSKYGYALEMLCRHFGKSLPNARFCGMYSHWADEVDRGLIRAGVPEETLRLTRHLMYRGSPVPIPKPKDFPAIGYLKAAEVGPALRAVEAADLGAPDPVVREAVAEVRGWLGSSVRSACDLVCFYH